MSTAALNPTDIQAFTAEDFSPPDAFVNFCSNGGQPLDSIIGGKRVPGSMNAAIDVINPGTKEVLARVAEMGYDEVNLAVECGYQAYHRGWKNTSVEERAALILKLVELFERDKDVFLACEILNGGKVSELAEGDMGVVRGSAEYFVGIARKALFGDSEVTLVGKSMNAYTHVEPWGVVAGIIPWNYPVVLTAWFMMPALMAGNCIIIKPSEETPLSALYLAKLAEEAGFPAGVINVLPGRGELTGKFISEHPGIRYISFTGSPGVGQAILQAADKHGTRVKREMGGNGSAIVCADADPELVARMIGRNVNQHYGQTCSTIHRVFAERSVFDDFLQASEVFFKELVIGNQAERGTQLGPVINSRQPQRIMEGIAFAKAKGADAILEGGHTLVPGHDGYYLKPTLLRSPAGSNCNPSEVFHAFVNVQPVDSVEQALQFANNTLYGLGSSVWTKDLELGQRIAKQFRDGTGQVNCHNTVADGIPYAGQGISGGPGGGVSCADTLRDYLQTKAIYISEYPG
ncbi:aldehyde dehydrogenase family protein [Candidatus Pelagisphaera phototrophica]|uniref:aldehyde dehydrogenase family protein n=1 Tax=Candidatus Pelagisphaera phototrophica TaxID=2684113 RepID=UPI001A07E921|nr:aldehyde dehydrogenase family protein [Candidatus Pelagisphaera phototrophica]QXD30705.1 aldehyde dehydrogenase family protein [Candidatus Pelagisphaera phototrophica]